MWSKYDAWNIQQVPPAEILPYILTDEFKSLCRVDLLCPKYVRQFQTQNALLFRYFLMILSREATWALARPILGQLRTLTIPTSDIGRYFRVIDQLASLEHVQFQMDESLDSEQRTYFDVEPEASDFTRMTKERKDAVMRDVIQFVKDLTRLFPGTVKTATFLDAVLWPQPRLSFSEETQLEVYRLLPPLARPMKLTASNWVQFMAHPRTMDLGAVKEIVCKDITSHSFGRLFEDSLLQKCRALTLLDIPSLGLGSFAWAVQEKRELDALKNNNSKTYGPGSTTLLLDTDRPAYVQHGLAPLESVNIVAALKPFADEVDDIAFAFSETLTTLTAHAATVVHQFPRTARFGRGWVTLLRLKHLSLHAVNARLVIDRRLLSVCPNLESIHISDDTFQYQCQDLHPQLCLPASLARLTNLTLAGWAALTFHPDTLHTTRDVTYLDITHLGNGSCYIPPIEELNQSFGPPTAATFQDYQSEGGGVGAMESPPPTTIFRPHWSWDWCLPQLNTLFLSSEFAYRFQFQMLRGCPALEVLSLNISTSTGQHPREVTISDLYAPVTSYNDNDSDSDAFSTQQQQQQEYRRQERIRAPRLRSLRLFGRWVLRDAFLPEFLTETFPNLKTLRERGWDVGDDGITCQGLVRCIRAAASSQKLTLEHLDLSLPKPTLEELAALGMVSGLGTPEGKTFSMNVYVTGTKYFLLENPANPAVVI
ncbi:hypothetical protein BGZ97_007009 [Linnemannia gamsii]|uniref:Uncharacterized protein n=1 Tax=Linnemannia gamsii TaxID=64522 RepID=A0A9P6URC3_9FUNG|nr:hypothetical protein BGZ97_007009 [Linnemannia gamsii]